MKKYLKEFIQILLVVTTFTFISLIFQNADEEKVVSSTNLNQLEISAESAIVLECNSHRILYQKNPNKILPPASLTKVLTGITALEIMDLSKYYLMENEFINIEGSKIYLEEHDFISGYDLLYGLLLRSGNDCAGALAHSYSGKNEDFIFKMNELAHRIGMNNSTFVNSSGLDENESNYTSAYDLALLMSYALENPVFRKITNTKKYTAMLPSGKKIFMQNKHKLVQNNYLATGGKTGYTKKAGRTLITSFKKDEMEIVVVTMNASNDWEIHEMLANCVFEQYTYRQVISKIDFYLSTLKYGKFSASKEALMVPLREDEKTTYEIIAEEDNLSLAVKVDEKVICTLSFKGEDYE